MRKPLAVLVAATLLMLAGCGNDSGGKGTGSDTLTVLAAASLTESFTTLAHDFEQQHPGVKVDLAFDSSATLAEQVNQGAPGDVLATADERTMQLVVDEGNTDGTPRIFATNKLVLVVPADNPAGIRSLTDLGKPGVKYVVCVASAPCGAIAEKVLADQGVTAPPASEEVDVKAVLSKVTLGEADAGLVYATDAKAAGDQVRAIPINAGTDAVTAYPIAALANAADPALAKQWVDLVVSDRGRTVLRDAGFGAP